MNQIQTKSKRGGKRLGAGRKAGTPNKSTLALKEVAGKYSEEAINTLVEIMRDSESPANVRLSAAEKLLDRSHGRPAVHVETTNKNLDPQLLDRIATEMDERLRIAREKQRAVLIERGILIEHDDVEQTEH